MIDGCSGAKCHGRLTGPIGYLKTLTQQQEGVRDG